MMDELLLTIAINMAVVYLIFLTCTPLRRP